MIKQKLTILAATIAVAASITTSQAALITGGISFFGGANFTPTGASEKYWDNNNEKAVSRG